MQLQNLQNQASALQNQMSALVLSAVKGTATTTTTGDIKTTTFTPTNSDGTINQQVTCPTPPGGSVWILHMPTNFEPNSSYWCNSCSGVGYCQYSSFAGGSGSGTFSVTAATNTILKPISTTTITNTTTNINTATQNTSPILTTFAPTNPDGTVNKELTCPTPPGGTVWLLNMPSNFEPNNSYWCNHATGGVVQYGAYAGGSGAGTFSATTATSTVLKPVSTTNSVFSRTLKVGMSGDDVKALQLVLRTQGFLPASASIDGSYGSITAAAVKTYQATKGLTADGVAGTQTLQSILNIQINDAPILTTFAPTNPDGTVNQQISCANGTSVTILNMPSNFEPNNDYWCSHCSGETVGGTIPCQYSSFAGGAGNGTFSATVAATNAILKPTTTNTTTTSAITGGVFSKSLKSGFSGGEVQLLQLALRMKGYLSSSVNVDGMYGDATVSAVKAFQTASGLVSDGIAGMKTLQKLFFGSAL